MRVLAFSLVLGLLCASAAQAQEDRRPIGVFAFDVRGFYSGLGQDPVTAAGLGIDATALPGRALGGVAGAHVYLLRRSSFAIGVGAEAVLAHANAQQHDPTTGDPVGPAVHQQMRGLAPQVSLNFGHRQGWSYMSAGMGPLSLSTYQGDSAPVDPPPVMSTINLGVGARWFSTQHLAFCFDMRFYLTRPADASESYPARQRTRVVILSAGIGIK